MFASTAILYNHESPRRPTSFVARKISHEVARIALGKSDRLALGNIDVHRDWGYAPDYVDAMIRIVACSHRLTITSSRPDDSHTVREFVDEAFRHVGVEDWEQFVVIDPALYRPADPKELVGDPSRLRALGWRPSVDFTQLVALMVDHDLDVLRAES